MPENSKLNGTLDIPANTTLKIEGDFDASEGVISAYSSSNLVVTGKFSAPKTAEINYNVTADVMAVSDTTKTISGDLEIKTKLYFQGSITLEGDVTVGTAGKKDGLVDGKDNNVVATVKGTMTVYGDNKVNTVVLSANSLYVTGTMSGKLTVGDTKNEGKAVIGTQTGDVSVINGTLTINEKLDASNISGSEGAVITFAKGAELGSQSKDKFTNGTANVTNVAGQSFTFDETKNGFVNEEAKVEILSGNVTFVWDQQTFVNAGVPTNWLAWNDKTGNAVWDEEGYVKELAAHPYVYVTAEIAKGVTLNNGATLSVSEVKINGKAVDMTWTSGDSDGVKSSLKADTEYRWGFDILKREASNISMTAAESVKAGDSFEITLTLENGKDNVTELVVTGTYNGAELPVKG